MNTSLEVLEAEALKLTPADRSHLLERLIASLDLDPEVEEAWEREADRREAELASGVVLPVPGHETIARLRGTGNSPANSSARPMPGIAATSSSEHTKVCAKQYCD